MKPEQKKALLRWGSLILILGVSVALFLLRDRVRDLGQYGYPGIFLVSLLTNATLILPLPGVLVTTMMGAVFNPLGVALAAGTGSALGELSGYIAGYGGQGVIENRQWYDRLIEWMKKYGDVTILVLAIIPNPLFDVGGMAAGALRLPVWRFLLWCTLGKIIKMLAFAYGGSVIGHYIPLL